MHLANLVRLFSGLVLAQAAIPTTELAAYSTLAAYVSTLTTAPEWKSLYFELPMDVVDQLEDWGEFAPVLSSLVATFPYSDYAYFTSVVQAERSILKTTMPASEVIALFSSLGAESSSVYSFLTSVLHQPGASSALTWVAPGPKEILSKLFILYYYMPIIEQLGGDWPEDTKSLISKIISFENSVYHTTVTAITDPLIQIAFPTTTVTQGTFIITPTTGASAESGGPAATATSTSSSSDAAPSGLGCGGTCCVMAGAMFGVALGAIIL